MSNNKQSSVEWYSNEIGKITALALNGKMTGLEWKYLQAKALEQAKAMHKEETIDFGNDLLAQNDINYIGMPNLAEQYYNETYDAKK